MDILTSQNVLNIVLSTSIFTVGWFARELWSAVKELKSDLARIKEDLPRQYTLKDDYRDDMKDIKIMLSKLLDRLDGKQDKSNHPNP